MVKLKAFIGKWIIFIIAACAVALAVGIIATDDDDGGRVGQTPPTQEEPTDDDEGE